GSALKAEVATPALEVTGLQAGYGAMRVLHDLSLQVQRGEIVGVLGANGMGKSTLMKTLAGVIPNGGGEVFIDGMEISRLPTYARAQLGLGYVQQGRGILPQLSVRENLAMGWTASLEESEDRAVARVLALFPRLEPL
ncbi:ATP-binding cassette domain-containing protein, partial [Arthrospira platensis SPKY1]|nr:ATP-binding cassette domain-containing protein [Arthrospira platensis SPKY1]